MEEKVRKNKSLEVEIENEGEEIFREKKDWEFFLQWLKDKYHEIQEVRWAISWISKCEFKLQVHYNEIVKYWCQKVLKTIKIFWVGI